MAIHSAVVGALWWHKEDVNLRGAQEIHQSQQDSASEDHERQTHPVVVECFCPLVERQTDIYEHRKKQAAKRFLMTSHRHRRLRYNK